MTTAKTVSGTTSLTQVVRISDAWTCKVKTERVCMRGRELRVTDEHAGAGSRPEGLVRTLAGWTEGLHVAIGSRHIQSIYPDARQRPHIHI